MEVKLFEQDGELYVLAGSEGRQMKVIAIRRKRLVRLLRKLRAMRIGAAKTEAGRAFGFVRIRIPAARQPVTGESFRFSVDKSKLK